MQTEVQVQMGHPMLTLLRCLDEAGVDWVSWKNNHETHKALSGEANLDIFVPRRFRTQVLSIAYQNGWLQIENPIARFPGVVHLFSVADDLRILHLHAYFGVVTGESWLKEFVLPFDDYLLAHRIRAPDTPVWVLDKEAQAYVFAVRHLLKGGSLLSRILYFRERASYAAEWAQCCPWPEGGKETQPIDLQPFRDGARLDCCKLSGPRILTSLRFRGSLFPFLRIRWYALPLQRILAFGARILNVLVFRRTRVFPHGGAVVAVTGVDGAGKSTLLRELEGFFGPIVTVRRVHLGRPQGVVLERVRKSIRHQRVSEGDLEKPAEIPSGSVMDGLAAVSLALLRLRNARKAERLARRGYLILADRYPTGQVGRMDGPRLARSARAGWLRGAFARLEAWAYSRMPRADICISLQVPLSLAIERNRLRSKFDKETDLEIGDRFIQNLRVTPFAKQILTFDNSGDLKSERAALIRLLWNQLARH